MFGWVVVVYMLIRVVLARTQSFIPRLIKGSMSTNWILAPRVTRFITVGSCCRRIKQWIKLTVNSHLFNTERSVYYFSDAMLVVSLHYPAQVQVLKLRQDL